MMVDIPKNKYKRELESLRYKERDKKGPNDYRRRLD